MGIMPWWLQLVAALSLVAGCVVAVVRGLWKYDVDSHKWRTCKCEACHRKRFLIKMRRDVADRKRALRQAREKGQNRDGRIYDVPEVTRPYWVSTTLLTANMKVKLNGHPYRVVEVRTDMMGYLVALQNMATRNEFIVTVSFRAADLRYWEPFE